MKNRGYVCQECAQKYLKWQGFCYACKKYDSIIESVFEQKKQSISGFELKKPSSIGAVDASFYEKRVITSCAEFDRVLGGGLVSDSVILLCGQPGVGKSTFLLQIVSLISISQKTLYISTEESEGQVKFRFERLGKKEQTWFLIRENNFELIIGIIEDFKPQVVILDSLQNISMEEHDFGGSIQKLRHSMQILVDHAKKMKYILLVTGHITKEGVLAGPKVLEHLVDVVLYLESLDEGNVRLLRSSKNRFGSVDECGFFIMSGTGLQEYENPQEIFLENAIPAIGSAFTWISGGSRPFLVEIQTLLNFTKNPSPQRVMYGVDSKQFLLLCAVVEKYLKIPLYEFDIFCKLVSNYKIKDPHIDLALLVSIISSYKKKSLKKKILFHGEVNLSGNIVSKYDITPSLHPEKYGIDLVVKGKTNKNHIHVGKDLVIASLFEVVPLFD